MGFLGIGDDKQNDGWGVYLFGIPLFEDARAADKRRNDKTDRREIEEASDVAKRQSKDRRRVANTSSRNEQQTLSSYFRNADGSNPSESIAGSIAGAVPGLAGAIAGAFNPLSGLFGGGGISAPAIDMNTLLIGGLIIGGLAIATRE